MNKSNSEHQDYTKIQSKWMLSSLDKQSYISETTNKHPTIIFDLEENRINGNDGYNQFFGSINSLDQENIELGTLAGTKMMCSNYEYSDQFNKMLESIRSYRVTENALTFFSENGDELSKFKRTE